MVLPTCCACLRVCGVNFCIPSTKAKTLTRYLASLDEEARVEIGEAVYGSWVRFQERCCWRVQSGSLLYPHL